MAKKIVGLIKLQVPAGKANPSPPIGPALGQHAINIMQFCKEYNEKTASQAGMIVPPRFAAYPACEDAIWRAIQRALRQELSPAQAVARAAATVRRIVNAAAGVS